MTPIKSQLYDKLKFLAQIFLPALGTFYAALSGIWGLPASEEITATILAVDTFLGVILQLSSSAYSKSDDRFDGEINMLDREGDIRNFSLSYSGSAETLENAEQVVLKVNKPS